MSGLPPRLCEPLAQRAWLEHLRGCDNLLRRYGVDGRQLIADRSGLMQLVIPGALQCQRSVSNLGCERKMAGRRRLQPIQRKSTNTASTPSRLVPDIRPI
jgi:hypothetical protein